MPPIFELLNLLAVKVVNHVFFGVLNWGLGHASRSSPIIEYLIGNGIKVTIGSDGNALSLLKKEFPNCEFVELPAYNIEYSNNPWSLPFKLICQIPKLIKVIKQEKKQLASEIERTKYDLIISDNRYGIRNKNIPSVILSHQLQIQTPSLATWINIFLKKRLSKFDRIWVPDTESTLSGALSKTKLATDEIGWLSAIKKKEIIKDIDVLVILSGPEPQRTILETKLNELVPSELNSVIVRGVKMKPDFKSNFSEKIDLASKEILSKLFSRSKMVISRSGYSSLMDYKILNQTAVLIPTPGQTEQEYLGEMLSNDPQFKVVKQSEIGTDIFYWKPLNKLEQKKSPNMNEGALENALKNLGLTTPT